MMNLLLRPENQTFPDGQDLETLLTYMSGCAIRERLANMASMKKHGNLPAAKSLTEDDKDVIRKFCRVIVLLDAESQDEVDELTEQVYHRFLTQAGWSV